MTSPVTDVYEEITGADDDVRDREARNGVRHMVSLSMTKVADGLIDPKLVLSWLAGALGAPAALTGLLVPIREAGALLPQIALAGWVQSLKHRKWAWVFGSLGQGAAAAAIVFIALTLQGLAAGIALCAALAVLALSRAACSVSYKDILGKTVEKTRRGAVTGVAGSTASIAVIVFAGLLLSGLLRNVTPVIIAIGLAAMLWVAAATLFSRLEEEASDETEDTSVDFTPLRDDKQFRLFIAVRGLLTVTALAPPYFVLLGGGQSALQGLGALLLASAAAAFVSSYIWGRFSDRSSRKVLFASGLLAAFFASLAVLAQLSGWADTPWVIPVILFFFMLSYQGVRSARSVYLVDMSPEDARSNYAALANTAIGILLLATGAFGGLLALAGPVASLIGFAVLSVAGGMLALKLDEVQTDD
ncbi:MFS transporter [Marivita hallyeonensis]|uniref:Predicted arabinose efflux permease, MFS family n=1 Tax=Marivita hallyeonensis TaxID=996342 RepID=A0A1M5P4P0_9RHOB|nr:MFS transporter [Marivita hallyeonensis]SHG96163.1 Predicted arabinose efflux permease, MFS family [Marivita hallyeonensis]